jgi:hypothetical protein
MVAMFMASAGFGIGLCVIWSWIRQPEQPAPTGDHDKL